MQETVVAMSPVSDNFWDSQRTTLSDGDTSSADGTESYGSSSGASLLDRMHQIASPPPLTAF